MSRIALLLATYNGDKYLKELLDSLLRQTNPNFLCYIHDDGSEDNTISIIKEYKCEHPSKFKILNFPIMRSPKKVFMRMLSYVEEDYVMFCDQDDVWFDNKIEETYKNMVKVERKGEKKVLVFSDLTLTDDNLNIIDNSFLHYSGKNTNDLSLRRFLVENMAPGCTIMMNRGLYKDVLLCKNIDGIKMHDWWAMLVASSIGKIEFINKSLIYYRQHGNNSSVTEKKMSCLNRLLYNISRIKKNDYFNNTSKYIKSLRMQAKELYDIGILKGEEMELLYNFIDLNIDYVGKFVFYFRSGINKSNNNFWFNLLYTFN